MSRPKETTSASFVQPAISVQFAVWDDNGPGRTDQWLLADTENESVTDVRWSDAELYKTGHTASGQSLSTGPQIGVGGKSRATNSPAVLRGLHGAAQDFIFVKIALVDRVNSERRRFEAAYTGPDTQIRVFILMCSTTLKCKR